VPYEEEPPELFGRMQDTGAINGDIMAPLDVDWDAYHE